MTTATDPKHVFAEKLSRARKRLGKSQDWLAQEIGLTRQTIFKYEKAEITPGMDVVYKISKVLNIRVEYFFEKSSEQDDFEEWLNIIDFTPFIENSITDVRYRQKQDLETEVTNQVKSETYKEIQKILYAEHLTNNKISFKNPVEDFQIKSKEDAEKAAIEVRKKWHLYDNPIANVIGLLESKGIRVIEIDASEKFHGLSAKYGDLPIIVLNFNAKEVTRKRFTALHELGHLVLQIQSEDHNLIEQICNAFAAVMLMPRQLLILELGKKRSSISNEELIRIKERYGISAQAIIVGATIAQIISKEVSDSLRQQASNIGYNETFRVLEKATRIDQLLSIAQSEGKIDERKMKQLKTGKANRIIPEELLTDSL